MFKSFLSATLAASMMATTALASDDKQDQQFKGIGIPIIFILCFAAAVGITHKQLIMAHQASSLNPSLAWIFRGALLTSVLSIFLYATPAWPYGLMSSVLCYYLALVCASSTVQTQGRVVMVIILLWFGILVGLPSALGTGIIEKLSKNHCTLYYLSYADKMCKDGWLTFAMILAGIQIGLTFLSLLTVMSAGVESSTSGEAAYATLPDGGATAPGVAANIPTPKSDYESEAGYQQVADGSACSA